jgi:Spy/CpxP family protein refolding chaperone
MKKIALMLLALVTAKSLFAQNAEPSATAQTSPQPRQAPMKRSFWDQLNLTDDQKQRLKQIREADRESLRSAWAQVKIDQELLHAALLANPENTADIQTKATNLANALSAKSVQLALHEAKINQVLTPTQRIALEEAKKRHKGFWHRRGGGRESGTWQQQHPWLRENRPQDPAPPAAADVETPEIPTN